MIGNFIADSVKGRNYKNYPEKVMYGILLHRAIDSFTDQHPVTTRTKERLRPQFRKYAGVVTDVFYDHFLAKNWDQFSATPLKIYTEKVYDVLTDHFSSLPLEIQQMLPFMIRGNWLYHYSKIEGVHKALSGMAKRTPFESNMEFAAAELEKNYGEYEKEFNLFFPELTSFAKAYTIPPELLL
jgi:acyl carrier protein phosphodiesterase